MKIVVDVGHGGKDGGAWGNNLIEKELNLEVAKKMKTELEKYENVVVVLTRDTDVYKSFEQRAEVFIEEKPDLITSEHFNGVDSIIARGYEIVIPLGNHPKSSQLAELSKKNVVEKTGIPFRRIFTRSYTTNANINYYRIIREAIKSRSIDGGIPEINLNEGAFITNSKDAELIHRFNYIDLYVEARVQSIVTAYNLKKKINSNVIPKWLVEFNADFIEAIQKGITDGSRPDEAATRKETAVMILRAVKMLENKK